MKLSLRDKSANKDQWIEAREWVLEQLMQKNNWTEEKASQFLENNPELIEDRVIDIMATRSDYLNNREI